MADLPRDDARKYFRDGKRAYWNGTMHFLEMHAALGDLITSIPSIIWSAKQRPKECKHIIWVPEHQCPLIELFLKHAFDGTHVNWELRNLHEFEDFTKKKEDHGPAVMNCLQKNFITRNKMDMVEYAYLTHVDYMPRHKQDPTAYNYPTGPVGPKVLDGDYVVVSSNATSDNKLFHPRILSEVIKGVAARGFKPVILGKSETHVRALGDTLPLIMRKVLDKCSKDVQDLCINLMDKTTLLEGRDVIAHAKGIIGVDGGLLHLAGTTDTPIVYCITSVDPEDRAITRDGVRNKNVIHVTPRDLECAGCQSHWVFAYGHDFRTCLYDDNKCTELLHPDDIFDALDTLLEKRI